MSKSLGDQHKRLQGGLPLVVCTLQINDPNWIFDGKVRSFTKDEIFLPSNSTVGLIRASKKDENKFHTQRVITDKKLTSFICHCKKKNSVSKSKYKSNTLKCSHCNRIFYICPNCKSIFSLVNNKYQKEHCCRYCGAEVGYRCISCGSFILLGHTDTKPCLHGRFKCSFCGYCCLKCELKNQNTQHAYGERDEL